MKTFSSNLSTRVALDRGNQLRWILKFGFATGAVYLSSEAFTVSGWQGGPTTKAWIKGYETIKENLSDLLASPTVSQWNIEVINDLNDASNIISLLEDSTNYPEKTRCEVYLWDKSLDASTDPPVHYYTFNIDDWPRVGGLVYRLELVDESENDNPYVGEKITVEKYPGADPDDIGLMEPIPIGWVKDVPARCILSGALDSLDAAISSTSTSLTLVDATRFPNSGTIGIEEEEITYTGKDGHTLTGLTRGVNGTSPNLHQRGMNVWEVRSDFAYLTSYVPIQGYEDVYAQSSDRKMKITSVCVLYTGQTGSSHPSWPGRGIIIVPARITLVQAVSLLVEDGIGVVDIISILDQLSVLDTIDVNDLIDVSDTIDVSDLINVLDGIGVSDTITISDLIDVSDTINVEDGINVSDSIGLNDPTHAHSQSTVSTKKTYYSSYDGSADNMLNAVDGDEDTYATIRHGWLWDGYQYVQQTTKTLTVNFDTASYGTIINKWLWVKSAGSSANYQIHVAGQSLPSDLSLRRINLNETTWGGSMQFTISTVSPNMVYGYVYEVYLEYEYTPSDVSSASTGVGKTGSASKTGFASKTGLASKTGSATKTGGADKTGSASKTGSATKTGGADKTGSASKTGSATKTGSVDRAGSVYKTGTVTVTGNSTADAWVAEEVLVRMRGMVDEDGSITGTAGTLIERPYHVFPALLKLARDWPVADFTTAAQEEMDSRNYRFAGVINEYYKLRFWTKTLAAQCQCYFRFHKGKAELRWRYLCGLNVMTITDDHVIMDSAAWVKQIGQSRVAMDEIINYIDVHYDRDWSKPRGQEGSYRGNAHEENAESIERYGYNEKPELFFFDFVTSPSMAKNLAYHYMSLNCKRFKRLQVSATWHVLGVESGDHVIAQAEDGGLYAVRTASPYPGSAVEKRCDAMQLAIQEAPPAGQWGTWGEEWNF